MENSIMTKLPYQKIPFKLSLLGATSCIEGVLLEGTEQEVKKVWDTYFYSCISNHSNNLHWNTPAFFLPFTYSFNGIGSYQNSQSTACGIWICNISTDMQGSAYCPEGTIYLLQTPLLSNNDSMQCTWSRPNFTYTWSIIIRGCSKYDLGIRGNFYLLRFPRLLSFICK